ncbi:MAG: class I SAM-dependent methyltransferase [Myxococcales bacterium]|nr:class I SAM-dependent methyltransferase [Myxococcales bacterium]
MSSLRPGASPSDPYATIAAIYDAEFSDADADIRTFARDMDGAARVLVLGCGTGRVSEALRAPRRTVVGVDLSAPMIARAKVNAAQSVARRAGGRGDTGTERPGDIEYVVADMCALEPLGLAPFDAAVIPNAAFSFLTSRRDQLRCLAGLRDLVSGPLWIDLPMPDFALLGAPHTPEAPAWLGTVGELRVRRTREVWRHPVQQRLSLLDRYYHADDPGAALLAASRLELRLIFPAELEWLLEVAGFYADAMYGDHAGGPLREGCPRLLVRAL